MNPSPPLNLPALRQLWFRPQSLLDWCSLAVALLVALQLLATVLALLLLIVFSRLDLFAVWLLQGGWLLLLLHMAQMWVLAQCALGLQWLSRWQKAQNRLSAAP